MSAAQPRRLVAAEALARLLRIIPAVSEQPDGMSISEIVERFDYPRSQFLKDFSEAVLFVGVAPFTPDVEIWAEITEDRVYVERPHWFSHPLRMPRDEAARVLALCRAALEITEETGYDMPDALLSAFLKLSDELGSAGDTAVEVRLGSVGVDILELARGAVVQRRSLDLNYYSGSEGAVTRRRVDPYRVFSAGGFWYLDGWCHLEKLLRPFRLDRILEAEASDASFDPADHEAADGAADPTAFASGDDKPRVVLRVDPAARWMLEVGFPVEEITESDKALQATLTVASAPWLERLLLRLGPHAEIVRLDSSLPADVRSEAAARVLARYR